MIFTATRSPEWRTPAVQVPPTSRTPLPSGVPAEDVSESDAFEHAVDQETIAHLHSNLIQQVKPGRRAPRGAELELRRRGESAPFQLARGNQMSIGIAGVSHNPKLPVGDVPHGGSPTSPSNRSDAATPVNRYARPSG